MKSDRRKYYKAYYQAHRRKKIACSMAYYWTHKEQWAKYCLKYQKTPKGKATARRYYLAHKEKLLALNREWIKKHWGNWRNYNQYLNDKIQGGNKI